MLLLNRGMPELSISIFDSGKIAFSFPRFAAEFPGDAIVATWLYDLVSWLYGL